MNNEVKRLFFAIDLPGDLRRKAVSGLPLINGMKPSKEDQLHLTLLFLGDVQGDRLEDIKESVSSVPFIPLALEISGSGFFPDTRRPSIFWLGFKENSVLTEFQDRLLRTVKNLGMVLRDGRFVPHVTLGRIRHKISRDDAVLLQESMRPLTGLKFQVNDYLLFSSVLCPSGAVHSVEAVFEA